MSKRWTRSAFAAAALVLGSASCSSTSTAPTSPQQITESEARARAEAKAREEGVDLAQFPVARIDRDELGQWLVFFEHVPPARTGEHFHVVVGRDVTRLVPGK